MPVVYKPGDTVRMAGIYRVEHGSGHRLMHKVTIHAGTKFPSCRQCHDHVRFTLDREIRGLVIIPFRSTEVLQEFRKKDGPLLVKRAERRKTG